MLDAEQAALLGIEFAGEAQLQEMAAGRDLLVRRQRRQLHLLAARRPGQAPAPRVPLDLGPLEGQPLGVEAEGADGRGDLQGDAHRACVLQPLRIEP